METNTRKIWVHLNSRHQSGIYAAVFDRRTDDCHVQATVVVIRSAEKLLWLGHPLYALAKMVTVDISHSLRIFLYICLMDWKVES